PALNNGTLSGLCNGDYTLTAALGNQCSISETIPINGPTQVLSLQITQLSFPTLVNNGWFQLAASGGTPPYQYGYDSTGTWQPSGSFFGLTVGIYQMNVKDA